MYTCTYHMYTWPDMFAAMLHEDDAVADWAVNEIHMLRDTIQRAEAKLLSEDAMVAKGRFPGGGPWPAPA